jgi:hypothetical protein
MFEKRVLRGTCRPKMEVEQKTGGNYIIGNFVVFDT